MEIVVSLVVVIIAQFVTLLVTDRNLKHQSIQAENQRIEARRAEWKSYLIRLMDRLIDAREEYEKFLGTDKSDDERLAGIIGKAIAICLAANDHELLRFADPENKYDGLTPYKVNIGHEGAKQDWASRNRDGIHSAVRRLAAMINEA